MSEYAVGTIVQNTIVGEAKYEYDPREAQDERPWKAIDVPPILLMLMGDENKEVRFDIDDIQESIDDGELVVIHIP